MTTINARQLILSERAIADLLGAIDTSLGEGQEGAIVARELRAQGVEPGPEARACLDARPRVEPCACMQAVVKLRSWLLLTRGHPGESASITCEQCGKVHHGKVDS